jgi:chemotaxis protein MotB
MASRAEGASSAARRQAGGRAGHGGHHGGAWKVAYADFVTAMMAFFLLLWLISSASEDTLKGLSEYFSSATVNVGTPGGLGGMLHGLDVSRASTSRPRARRSSSRRPAVRCRPTDGEELSTADGAGDAEGQLSDEAFEAERERREQAMFEQAAASIERALAETPELRRFEHNWPSTRRPRACGSRSSTATNRHVPVGSDQMYPTRGAAGAWWPRRRGPAQQDLGPGPHRRAPLAPGAVYDNWRLSSDRANANRRALTDLGLPPAGVADVTGKGDADPWSPDNPHDPRNRGSRSSPQRGGAGRARPIERGARH